jgi:hypothetical protein
MRRHPALHDLSRDHHVLLLHARRLRGEDARVAPEVARERFLRFAPILLHHVAEEEAAIAPRLEPGLRQRMLLEHGRLRGLVARLDADPAAAGELGRLLRDHVRFEEREAFPDLEARLAPADWERLRAEALRLRTAARPDSVGPGAAEACHL